MPLRKASHRLTVTIARAACALSIAAALQPALASAPVPKSYTGCVSNGVFKNEAGYVISIRQPGGGPMDLSQWENKMLRISGNLLPGDIFFLTAAPVVVGPCR